MSPQIAFIGLGLMGQAAQAITTNLVARATNIHPLILYNRTLLRAEEHSLHIGHSTVVATSIKDVVAKADIIWSCVEDHEAVEQTFREILSTAEHDLRGKLFIESSTIPPDSTNRIAKQVLDAGGEFVAMPVFGDPTVAAAGKLVCVPAGSASSVARVLPYLTGVIAQDVINLSDEEPGQASLLKMIGNVLIMSTMEMVAEVNVFAEKTGLGAANAQKLVEAFPKAASVLYSKRMNNGDYYQGEPSVEVSKARTLTSKLLDLAKSSNVSLPSYEVAVKHLAVAEKYAGPKCDITGIYGAVRVESDLDFSNKSAVDGEVVVREHVQYPPETGQGPST